LLPFVKAMNNNRIVFKESDPEKIPFVGFSIIVKSRVESGMEGHKIHSIGPGKMILSNYPFAERGAGID
jgi:hypothetical protein